MINKKELEIMINDCIEKKGWDYDRCKRYILGEVYDMEENEDKKTMIIEAVPILKVGNWTDNSGYNVSFDIKDLDEISKNTNALIKSKLLEPPLKLGHNEEQKLKDGLPSLGYVANVYRLGNQLFADFVNVPKKLYELLKNRAYSKISSEVYLNYKHPETKENIGKVLRAVSLLGADLPAIKGLGDILSLYNSENEKNYILSFSEENKKEDKMNNKMKIEDIKMFIKCDACIKFIEEEMKKDNKNEISVEELAIYLSKMRMMKLQEDMKIECPDGFEWNGIECLSKNKETILDGHVCPKGYKWDEKEGKCIPIEIEDSKVEETKIPDELKDLINGIKEDEMLELIKNIKTKEGVEFKLPGGEPKGWTKESFKSAFESLGGTFTSCVENISGIDNPERFCAWLKYKATGQYPGSEEWRAKEKENKKDIDKDVKKEIKMSENEDMIKLKEKMKEIRLKDVKNKIEELKNKNRDILIPALDEYIDNFVNYFIENENNMIKLSEDKTEEPIEFFIKFLNDFVNAKRVIFSEIVKNDEIDKIIQTEDTFNEGNMEVRNIRLAKLAEVIKKKENITYEEALDKANEILKGGKK